jgi:hypothetical protein
MSKLKSLTKGKTLEKLPSATSGNSRGTGQPISVVIPEETYQWLRRFAFDNETTLRSAVLEAFSKGGVPVPEDEAIDRRRR